jgi:hypothetical protein
MFVTIGAYVTNAAVKSLRLSLNKKIGKKQAIKRKQSVITVDLRLYIILK